MVVIERFTRQFAVLTRSSGRLSGEIGVCGCEMADADEVEPCDAPFGRGLGELALPLVGGVGEQLLVDMVGAGLAEVFESY